MLISVVIDLHEVIFNMDQAATIPLREKKDDKSFVDIVAAVQYKDKSRKNLNGMKQRNWDCRW